MSEGRRGTRRMGVKCKAYQSVQLLQREEFRGQTGVPDVIVCYIYHLQPWRRDKGKRKEREEKMRGEEHKTAGL